MNVLVYKTTGRRRSVLTVTQIADVAVDEPPDDLQEFADEHGGDFAEVEWPES